MKSEKSVKIPKTPLAAQLAEAEAIKREMTHLLRELELQATGQVVTKPGSWRHHPKEWLKRNGDKV